MIKFKQKYQLKFFFYANRYYRENTLSKITLILKQVIRNYFGVKVCKMCEISYKFNLKITVGNIKAQYEKFL